MTDISGAGGEPPEHSYSIRDRLGLHALDYPIPPSANKLQYMLGGLTFIGIVTLVVTGIFLDQFYNPSPLAAHDSVLYIMTRVRLGNWIRALHYWASTVVFITIFMHMVFVFWRRSYTRPREVTWWAGVGLFVVVFGLIFTGTVLRGDQEAGEAMAHAVAGAKLAGTLGSIMAPDWARSTTLFTRMHNLHVSALPLLLVLLIGLHFMLVRVLGIHAHEPKTARFTQHLRRLGGFGLLLFAGLGTLAALFPPGIGHPAVEGVEVTKPFWPFLWIYAVENTMGMTGMILAPLVIFGFLAAVPLLDRGHAQGAPRPRWLMALAVVMLLLYVGGIFYGVFAPQKQHLGM
ncbi:MAG: cytochrome b N-terminal domain-containing protein [Gemmatimonadales bacterium]